MSLFPAYGGGKPPAAADVKKTEESAVPATDADWKSNKSYEKGIEVVEKEVTAGSAPQSYSSEESSSSSDEEESPAAGVVLQPQKEALPQQQRLEFDARTDGFYVDKKSNNSLRTVNTLTKPSRPRYKYRLRRLWDPSLAPWRSARRSKLQRYTKQAQPSSSLSENKHTPEEMARLQAQLMDTKVLVQREPQRLEHWLQLHRLLELNLDKANRLAVSEHQLHTLETALTHHPSNEQLLQLYTETASAAYPASEVS